MNAHQVLEWIKANLVIVIFAVVMIAAPVAMLFVAGGMNAGVREEVNKRAQKLPQMDIKVDVNGQQVVPASWVAESCMPKTISRFDAGREYGCQQRAGYDYRCTR